MAKVKDRLPLIRKVGGDPIEWAVLGLVILLVALLTLLMVLHMPAMWKGVS